MATNLSRSSGKKSIPITEAKELVLKAISEGKTVEEAMKLVGRGEETYKAWRKNDPGFRTRVDAIRTVREQQKGIDREPLPPFDEFCEKYLKKKLPPHLLRIWDVFEGREPRDLEPVFRYDPTDLEYEAINYEGAPAGRLIINCPPGHGKTTGFSILWCVYQIHRNPNIKIIMVCKDQGLAMDILTAIKFYLTDEIFFEMHAKFAPEGGWRDPDNSWSSTKIRVQGKDDGSHSPTFQALGIGGRIYGSRSDIIILDDSITLANVNEYGKQTKWLNQEVASRLDGGGMLALLGTRVAPVDLYSEVRQMEDWEGHKLFTYFSMPALVSEGDGGVENWVTLWPERFPARRLTQIRTADQAQWALVYQQQDVSENATFPHRAVEASINSQRFPGRIQSGVPGHRDAGMDGLYVVGGLDPATVGKSAIVVAAIDRTTGKRYLLDGINRANLHAQEMISEIQRLTDTYKINEWVIERNAAQRFITQIPQIEQWLRARGVRITPHNTNINKYDADFGIQAMAQLFLTCGEQPTDGRDSKWEKTPDNALIELPTPRQNAWVSELINQLVVWEPSGMKQNQKTDLVMALWFTNIAFSRIMDRSGKKRPQYMNNAFTTKGQKSRRKVINLADQREARREERGIA